MRRSSTKVISIHSYRKKKEGKKPIFAILSLLLSLPCLSLACFILVMLYFTRDWMNPYIQDLIYMEVIVCGMSLITLLMLNYVWTIAKRTSDSVGRVDS